MIEVDVFRNGELLYNTIYYQPTYSLEKVIKLTEMYIINEEFNILGECHIKARFSDLRKVQYNNGF